MKALRGDARSLRFLDFLIYRELEGVALHGLGVPVRIPTPERYAFHKLIVSRPRVGSTEGRVKARKDLARVSALLQALMDGRPHELQDIRQEPYGTWPRMEKAVEGLIRRIAREGPLQASGLWNFRRLSVTR